VVSARVFCGSSGAVGVVKMFSILMMAKMKPVYHWKENLAGCPSSAVGFLKKKAHRAGNLYHEATKSQNLSRFP
jgi:hypothetical protein